MTFAVSLVLGFYSILRTGEILGLRASQLMVDSKATKVVVSLGMTKGGKRQGAAESTVVGYDLAVFFLSHWKRLAKPHTPFAVNPAHWRSLFNQALVALKVEKFGFRPYSLRRGGATWWFSKHHSLDKILLQGRWQTPKTARMYLNEGLAVLAELQLPPSLPALAPFLHVFHRNQSSFTPSTLEPPLSKGSPGGRGKRPKRSAMKRQKFSVCEVSGGEGLD